MAVPAYATDLNDIYTDGGTWTTLAGRVTDPDTDDYIQGSSCWSHDPFSAGIEGGVVNSAETITAGHAVFVWTKSDIGPALATHAAGGVQVLIGNASTALKCFYVRGSDDLIYGGWKCIPVDPTKTQSTSVGSPTSTTSYFGVRWNIPSTGPTKGYPLKIDAIRHGRKLEVTAGEVANPATWDLTATHDANNARMWGICQPTDSGAALQGYIYWGTASALVYSRDSNKTIVINDTEWTDTDFTQIIFAHASNDVVWDNIGVKALGTNNRGIIDVTANGAITWTNSPFEGIDATNMLAGSTFDGSKWLGTNAVTCPAGSMLGCQVLVPTVAADTGALIYNSTTNPNGKLDGMTFSQGTNAHHAIDFGTSVTSDITLTNIEFSGFDDTSGEDQPGAALRFLATSGSLTCNLIGCTVDGVGASATNFFKDDAAGIAVTLAFDSITLSVTVLDATDDTPLTTAHVQLLKDSDKSVLLSGAVNGSGVISDSIGYDADTDVVGWAREHNMSGTDYVQQDFSGEYTANGFAITIRLEPAE